MYRSNCTANSVYRVANHAVVCVSAKGARRNIVWVMYSNKLLCKHRVEYDDDNTDDAEDDNNIAFGQWVSF